MHRVLALHARTLGEAPDGVDGPLPGPPSPFLRAWIAEAVAWATEAEGARVVEHYGRDSIAAWIQRFHRPPPAVRSLVRLDLREARVPRLRAGLDALVAGAAARGVDVEALWGVRDGAGLLHQAPRVLDLHPRSFFGCCQPMVSLGPVEQQAIEAAVADGWAVDELLDLRLAGHVLHEQAHGPARGWEGGPGSWSLHEAVAAVVNWRCQPDHVLAARPGEPVLGLRNALLLGHALVEAFGEDAVWRLALTATDAGAEIGRRLGHALVAVDWQRWARSGSAAFNPVHDRLFAGAKLVDVVLAGLDPDDAFSRLEEAPSVGAELALGLPDLLAYAESVPWEALPAWHQPVVDAHRAAVLLGVQTLFQVERLQPDLQACPADPPVGRVVLDVDRCALRVDPRRDDAYGLAAEWRFPPALCRTLRARGLRRLVVDGCRWEEREQLAARLLDRCEGSGRLPAEDHLDLRRRDPSRTEVRVPTTDRSLHHVDPVVTLGSCFATHIGARLARGGFAVEDTPFGILYDPISVARALEQIDGETPREPPIFQAHGRWHSPWHHLDFSDPDRQAAVDRMAGRLAAARNARGRRGLRLLTWGTARVWERGGEVVANCHGLPADRFTSRLLTVEEVVDRYDRLLTDLARWSPEAHVVLTVSPIRHLAAGTHDNAVSKAILVLAASTLCAKHDNLSWFPAYEIVLDELRDYRWFTEDRVHVSEEAADQVYERFLDAWVAPSSRLLARERAALDRALVETPRDPVRAVAWLDGLMARVAALPRSPVLPRAKRLEVGLEHARRAALTLLGEVPAEVPPEPEPAEVVVPEVVPVLPPVVAAEPVAASVPSLDAVVAPGTFVGWEGQAAWADRVAPAVTVAAGAGEAAAWVALDALLTKAEELEDPASVLPALTEPLVAALVAGLSRPGGRADALDALHRRFLRHVPRGHLEVGAATLDRARPSDRRALADLLAGELAAREAEGRRAHPQLQALLDRLRAVGSSTAGG